MSDRRRSPPRRSPNNLLAAMTPPFDPEGAGYDQRLYHVARRFYDREIAAGRFRGRNPYLPAESGPNKGHTPSSVPVGILMEMGVLSPDDLERFDLPAGGSFLLKGHRYETTPLELDAAAQKGLHYRRSETPLGERYVAYPEEARK